MITTPSYLSSPRMKTMSSITHLNFPNGNQAIALALDESADLLETLNEMGLEPSQPTLLIVGGASKMTEESMTQLKHLFVEVLAPTAEELKTSVIDGGTNSGVMQMMGQARSEYNATFPLIGIAPASKVSTSTESLLDVSGKPKPLEPHHSHFVLTPGESWGDESPWMAKIANTLSQDSPSVALLINGGEAALIDVTENVKVGRSILVVAGSGRLADEIAAAMKNPEGAREGIAQLLETGQLILFDLSKPKKILVDLLKQHLRTTV